MMQIRRCSRRARGAAAVEFAVLLPFLAFLFVIAVDWGRIFYFSITCENCARNGAMWLADPIVQQNSPYKNVTDAATADASDLSPAPAVTSTTGTDAYGQTYVEVTVTYTFTTVTTFSGVPNTTAVTRTVRMYVAPLAPN
jgi:Flp pilus assembly protein TadG